MNRVRPSERATALRLLVLIAMLAPLISTTVRADTYGFRGGHTAIHFSWSHAGLSTHWGRIIGAKGVVEFDPVNVGTSSVDVEMEPAEISTGNASLDRLLRGPDFFDVIAHPKMRFKSTAIQATGERTGTLTGDLTIKGITRPVTLAVTWNFAGDHPLGLVNPSFAAKYVAGFSATGQLRRSEWGLGRGVPLISDTVNLAIEAELVRTAITRPLDRPVLPPVEAQPRQ